MKSMSEVRQDAESPREGPAPLYSAAPGLIDLWRAAFLLPLLLHLTRSDLLARYRRTVLGPFWLTLGTAAGTLGLGFVWAELFKIDRAQFIPSLTVGLIMWQLISGCVVEASTSFTRQGMIIRNLTVPIAIHPMQVVLKHLVNFAHNAPVFVAVALFFELQPTAATLWAIPLLLLVALNLMWMTLLLSVLGARFRDLEHLIAAAMPLLMFLSPVFYRPASLTVTAHLVWFNPLSHLIEVVRYPLLGMAPPTFLLVSNVAMAAVGWAVALALFNAKRDRIAYWI
ncbi:MAG TPA: ABC transporter permease [Ramlibacter sp.]|nr:ABC transporter permease [Ramlibacter sp.]